MASRDGATGTGSATGSHRASSCRHWAGLARLFYTVKEVHAGDELTVTVPKARGRNKLNQPTRVHRPVLPVLPESSSRGLRRYTHHRLGIRFVIFAPSTSSRALTPPAPVRGPAHEEPR